MKPLNSGYLRVLKNLSVIERCPLWGGNLKKIITFVTCSLFGMSAIGRFHCNYKNTRTRKIIPYRTILITGLWLVRKVFYYEYVKQEKCIYFLPDKPFLLLFTFFQMQDFLTFYSLNIFIVWKGVSVPPSWYPPLSWDFWKDQPLPFKKEGGGSSNCDIYDICVELIFWPMSFTPGWKCTRNQPLRYSL